MSAPSESGPFTLSPTNAPFALVPGLVLMFTLAPAAAPAFPLWASALFCGFLGAMLGLVVYRAVRGYGPLARIGALTALSLGLWALSAAVVP